MVFSFPSDGNVDKQPRYRTTAYATGRLLDPATGQVITGITGTFTMLLNGEATAVTNRAMTAAPGLGTGYVRCTIAHTELAARGNYQWQMTLQNGDASIVATDFGDFTIS